MVPVIAPYLSNAESHSQDSLRNRCHDSIRDCQELQVCLTIIQQTPGMWHAVETIVSQVPPHVFDRRVASPLPEKYNFYS